MTVALTAGSTTHRITVPLHGNVRVGTLDAIVGDVAEFHGLPKHDVREALFG